MRYRPVQVKKYKFYPPRIPLAIFCTFKESILGIIVTPHDQCKRVTWPKKKYRSRAVSRSETHIDQ